jgi:hypothetical protein
MVGNDPSGRDDRDTAQQGQYTPVPSIAEQGTAQGAEADSRQHESERQQRITAIARRRQCERRWQNAKFFIECLAALATVVIMFLTGVYVHYSDKQWQVMSYQATVMATQSADLKRQIDDAEAVERASVVILNLRIEGFPKHPVIKFTLKNVGQTTATEITTGPGMRGSGWFKNMKEPYELAGAYGPGEHQNYEWLVKAERPSKAGFSLAQGETRDFTEPMTDISRSMNEHFRGHIPVGAKAMFPAPTFEDVAQGRASFTQQVIFTYLDASGATRAVVDCITYQEQQFVPCYGGHAEE